MALTSIETIAERLKEEVYKSGEFHSRYTSTSYHHQPYEALVTAMHQYIDSFLKRARADLDSGNLTPYDIEFLLNDVKVLIIVED
jgi:hypothetical protein